MEEVKIKKVKVKSKLKPKVDIDIVSDEVESVSNTSSTPSTQEIPESTTIDIQKSVQDKSYRSEIDKYMEQKSIQRSIARSIQDKSVERSIARSINDKSITISDQDKPVERSIARSINDKSVERSIAMSGQRTPIVKSAAISSIVYKSPINTSALDELMNDNVKRSANILRSKSNTSTTSSNESKYRDVKNIVRSNPTNEFTRSLNRSVKAYIDDEEEEEDSMNGKSPSTLFNIRSALRSNSIKSVNVKEFKDPVYTGSRMLDDEKSINNDRSISNADRIKSFYAKSKSIFNADDMFESKNKKYNESILKDEKVRVEHSREAEDRIRELMNMFQLLRRKYPNKNVKSISVNDDYDIAKEMYESMSKGFKIESDVLNYKKFISTASSGLEMISGKFFGIDLTGFGAYQIDTMDSYDALLVEMGEKYYAETSSISVEFRLTIAILLNAGTFIAAKGFAGKFTQDTDFVQRPMSGPDDM